jgi:ferritin-like metal-binding protein YciE
MESLHDLYVNELRDLYSAETQLVKALPKLAKAAASSELRAALEVHLEVTEGQVERLEQVLRELGVKAKGKKCVAMEGLLDEGKEMLAEGAPGSVRDAGLIVFAQKVEHYEMAGYGAVRTFANLLGYHDAAELLQESLEEEGEADKKLTHLAASIIKVGAEEAREADGVGAESRTGATKSRRRAKR